MSRIAVDPVLVQARWMLNLVGMIQRVRAELPRHNNAMDLTRAGADFSALGTALGCSAAEAETLYSRFRAIETVMNGNDFINLSDVDQG